MTAAEHIQHSIDVLKTMALSGRLSSEEVEALSEILEIASWIYQSVRSIDRLGKGQPQ